jgi:DNA-binding CsgD family transcriptional regulator
LVSYSLYADEVRMKDSKPLSPREDKIVTLAMQGYTDKEIAVRLAITPSTIKSYWVRIRQKTRSSTRTQAIAQMARAHKPSKASVVQAAIWSSLCKHAPYPLLVCQPDSLVLEANLQGHCLENKLPGHYLRDLMGKYGRWDETAAQVVATRNPHPMESVLTLNGWTIKVRGRVIPVDEQSVEPMLLFLVQDVAYEV